MAVHPSIAARLPMLDGRTTWADALADAAVRPRIEEFVFWPESESLPTVDIGQTRIPGPHGPITIRIYRSLAQPDGLRPALVWMHGGGFDFGDLDMPEADWTAREVVGRANATVITVDYRLAVGGVTYPVPHDDVVAAIRWTRDNAGLLGIDESRISVGGGGTGGNLATGAALRLRDEDRWQPAQLISAYALFHPVIPPPTPELATLLTELPRMCRFLPEDSQRIVGAYLGPGTDPDGYAMPALARLAGLCPTYLLNAEYDDLRASAEAFAVGLAAAGVRVRQTTVPGMVHGFLDLPSSIEPVNHALAQLAAAVSA